MFHQHHKKVQGVCDETKRKEEEVPVESNSFPNLQKETLKFKTNQFLFFYHFPEKKRGEISKVKKKRKTR